MHFANAALQSGCVDKLEYICQGQCCFLFDLRVEPFQFLRHCIKNRIRMGRLIFLLFALEIADNGKAISYQIAHFVTEIGACIQLVKVNLVRLTGIRAWRLGYCIFMFVMKIRDLRRKGPGNMRVLMIDL